MSEYPVGADPIAAQVKRSLADVPDGPVRSLLLASTNLMDNYTRGRVAEAIVAELTGAKMVGEGYGDGTSSTKTSASRSRPPATSSRGRRNTGRQRSSELREQRATAHRRTELTSRMASRGVAAKAYVFCHHLGVMPDDPADWMFYVTLTETLERICGDQQTIRLTSLVEKVRPAAADAGHLRSALDSVLAIRDERD